MPLENGDPFSRQYLNSPSRRIKNQFLFSFQLTTHLKSRAKSSNAGASNYQNIVSEYNIALGTKIFVPTRSLDAQQQYQTKIFWCFTTNSVTRDQLASYITAVKEIYRTAFQKFETSSKTVPCVKRSSLNFSIRAKVN